jgi:hypothetical protein
MRFLCGAMNEEVRCYNTVADGFPVELPVTIFASIDVTIAALPPGEFTRPIERKFRRELFDRHPHSCCRHALSPPTRRQTVPLGGWSAMLG